MILCPCGYLQGQFFFLLLKNEGKSARIGRQRCPLWGETKPNCNQQEIQSREIQAAKLTAPAVLSSIVLQMDDYLPYYPVGN